MQKTILITGATSGFGKACAEIFAQHSHNLIITGRRAERLSEIAGNLQEQYGIQVLPLAFDVQDKVACLQAIETLPNEWKDIDILVNNAGLALGRDLFDEASIEDWETMIDTNVKGLMYISKAVVPLMQVRGKGHIINMGSVAGKEIYERGNGYCASKTAVVALSRSMRIDLLKYKIKVTCINPGAADTEFGTVRFKGDVEKANSIYNGFIPLTPKDVAEVIYYTTTLPAHVCINDLDITCLAQADGIYFFKG
ncbi:MAG: SDR family NAD(P)-dependent oxidoreductase [Chitinophagaceae bacterium]